MANNELYGIYSVWHIPFWQTPWFFWFGLSIGLLGIAGVLFLYIRWLRRRRAFKTPWQEALAALELLANTTMQPNQGKEFYLHITIILKKYLQERYSLPVLGKTDQELIAYMETLDILKDIHVPLREVIEGASLIKFANVQSMQKQMVCDLERSKSFIKQTMPMQR